MLPVRRASRRTLSPLSSILLVLAVLAGLLAAAPTAGAQTTTADPMAKVEQAVLDQLDAKDEATFYVLLRDSAALGGAAAIEGHAERAGFVREQLVATAERSQAGLRAMLDAAGAPYRSFWIVNTIQVTGGVELLKQIAARDDVASVGAERTYELIEPTERAPDTSGRSGVQAVEWNIDRVRAPEVWSTFGNRGEGIVIATIDSGAAFEHPALVAKYRGNLGGGEFDHNYNWFDPAGVCPTEAPCDNNGHGTHVAGTLVGDDGDPGVNQVGVAPNARWIAVKGCETIPPASSCTRPSLLAAGEWMVAPTDLNGANPRPDLAPHVVNNSWGGTPRNDPWYQGIVDAWVAAGIFPTFANGNSGSACGTTDVPGAYLNSYAVGNHTINNTIAPLSSRGASAFGGEIKPNISAPGSNVRSSVPPNDYELFSGTSMAAPHVSATVALMWSAAPNLVGDIETTKALLDQTAIDVADAQCGGTPADNNVWGEGRLDAFAAVQASPRGSTGTLTGTVTDAASGDPLAGVPIELTGPNDRSTTSGPDGTWQLTLSTGSYELTVSTFGYVTHTATVEVLDGETTVADTALVPAAAHAVTGTVTDGDGAPVGGAVVTIAGTPIPATTTGPDGTYAFASVPEGTYQVTATVGGCLANATQSLTVDGDEVLNFTLGNRSDQFGHVCRPSEFDFIEAGTVLPLTGDDAATTITLPFPFRYYGQTHTTAFVSTNGHVNFLASSTALSNVAIPATGTPNAAIYPLWDDLTVLPANNSTVRTQLVGSAPSRRFVIEWRDVRFFNDTLPMTFEVVLHEDGRIQFQYASLANSARGRGNSATIGIENHAGNDALQYSFNQEILRPETSITFRVPGVATAHGTVTDANDGLPLAGATVRALRGGTAVATTTTGADGTYTFFGLPLGTYTIEGSATNYATTTAQAVLDSDDEVVTTNLALPTARAEAPAVLEVVVPSGERRTRGFTLRNTGGVPLTWQIQERGAAPGDVPWLAATPSAGTLAPGAGQPVTVLIDATGLAPGVHEATLMIVSNSGRRPETPVTVRVIVPAYQRGVNAGGGRHVDANGDTWVADQAFSTNSGFGYLDNRRSTRVTSNRSIAGTSEDELYQSAREDLFEYRFANVPNGIYEVEVRFAELKQQRANRRLYDVIVENLLLLPAHDIANEVGSFTADDHTFLARVTDGQLNVRLITRTGFGKPIINAVRVTERPDRTL